MWQSLRSSIYVRPIKFFRIRLLALTSDEIVTLLNDYDKEAKAFKKKILELCWWMRGGITYTELMQMPINDIALINEIIESNLETTKKSGLPFF